MSFATDAASAFGALRQQGFRLSQDGPHRLVCRSDRTVVEVEWDVYSGELNVYVSPVSTIVNLPSRFSLTDVERMAGRSSNEAAPPMVLDESKLEPFLRRAAAELQELAGPALALLFMIPAFVGVDGGDDIAVGVYLAVCQE